MAQGAVGSLDALREQIRDLEGARVRTRWTETGVSSVDALLGGLPMPGLVEIHGAPGSGRSRLALALAASWTGRGRLVAWVDPARVLYPPAAAQHGVDLQRLLVVQPPAGRASWAVEQILRSGCFPLVVLAGSSRDRRAGQRWARAAESGGCTGLLLCERPARSVPATVRLAVARDALVVVRNRAGPAGRVASLPPWPEGASPWG